MTRARIGLASSDRELASDQGNLDAAYIQLALVVKARVVPGLVAAHDDSRPLIALRPVIRQLPRLRRASRSAHPSPCHPSRCRVRWTA